MVLELLPPLCLLVIICEYDLLLHAEVSLTQKQVFHRVVLVDLTFPRSARVMLDRDILFDSVTEFKVNF